jgi:hypothetical protein
MYPLRCFRIPPGVRVPQVEYHCSRRVFLKLRQLLPTTWAIGAHADRSAIIIFPLAVISMQLLLSANRTIVVKDVTNHFLSYQPI